MAAQITHTNAAVENFLNESSGEDIRFDETNEPINGVFLGSRLVDDPFNPGKMRLAYDLEITSEGKQVSKSLTSGSKRLARAFLNANPAVGNFVKITRVLGETQMDTDYGVEASDLPF